MSGTEKDKHDPTIILESEALQKSFQNAEGSNRYTVIKTLGKGAMGVVYLAHDSVLDRDVAVKELHSNLAANADLMERFRREALVLAKMTHPGIVQIYDLVQTQSGFWIVMEFVKGEDLSNYIAKKKILLPEEVCSIGAQMAEALAYAHSLNIVHRDFKPGNVLLSHAGMPKIMDFGLAKLAQSAYQTASGMILGTPAYMSPEQAAGSQADARSDIYSLGITLYHMATGKVPFTGELASILAQHINVPPKPPKEINPTVPAPLGDVILRLLEKDPTKRIQDMTAVAEMLKKILYAPAPEVKIAAQIKSGAPGMDTLLTQKDLLEQKIKDQFTKHITVMFTDLKGSTAIADLQGNLAARMVIKKHMDVIMPVIKENRGVLVKTMGDGTMSYYEHEVNAVRAAISIQRGINAYNEGRDGQMSISLRAGISSGKAFVEEKDIFGDVVNVSSRFEAACNPGEIYISESTYEGLGENRDDFFIRHVRNVVFKGKSAPSKVYKVFYKPEEIEQEKKSPTDPDAAPPISAEAASKVMPVSSRVSDASGAEAPPTPTAGMPEPESKESMPRVSVFSRSDQKPSAAMQSAVSAAKMTEHKQQATKADKEYKGGIIKSGEAVRLVNEKYRVNEDIIVGRGGVLVLDNVELYFGENAGIVCMGAIRASKSVFSAIDPVKGWLNVVISAEEGDRIIDLDGCEFCFGRGRTPEVLKATSDIVINWPQTNISYGGGLIVAGGTDKLLKIKNTSFHKCMANEGGGIYFYRSQAVIDGCIFEGCMTKSGSGGGIHTFNSNITVNKCSFTKCSSGNNGGGACFTSSKNSVKDSVFMSCLTKRGGGGIACLSSDSTITGCRFENCSSMASGGAIFKDMKSNPNILHSSFQKCKPNDIS